MLSSTRVQHRLSPTISCLLTCIKRLLAIFLITSLQTLIQLSIQSFMADGRPFFSYGHQRCWLVDPLTFSPPRRLRRGWRKSSRSKFGSCVRPDMTKSRPGDQFSTTAAQSTWIISRRNERNFPGAEYNWMCKLMDWLPRREQETQRRKEELLDQMVSSRGNNPNNNFICDDVMMMIFALDLLLLYSVLINFSVMRPRLILWLLFLFWSRAETFWAVS